MGSGFTDFPGEEDGILAQPSRMSLALRWLAFGAAVGLAGYCFSRVDSTTLAARGTLPRAPSASPTCKDLSPEVRAELCAAIRIPGVATAGVTEAEGRRRFGAAWDRLEALLSERPPRAVSMEPANAVLLEVTCATCDLDDWPRECRVLCSESVKAPAWGQP